MSQLRCNNCKKFIRYNDIWRSPEENIQILIMCKKCEDKQHVKMDNVRKEITEEM